MDIVLAGSTISRGLDPDQRGTVSIELSGDGSEVGVGTIAIDDPAGTDEIAGGRQAKVSEGVALITNGFIGSQDKARGATPAQPHRQDLYQIQDANALFYGKRFVNRSRAAESDRARVLAFAAADLSGVDTTWVLNTNLATLPAKKYTGSDWLELMTDVFEATGKLIFLHDKANGTGRCLHSHKETEGHACGLSISDDPADANNPLIFSPANADRNRSAATLTNDVYGRDQDNRTSSDSDATSITAHDADGLKHQSVVEFEAASQSELDAKTSAHVTENKDEVDIYECDIGPLDQSALLLIRPGDRITVTSQAMGLSASTIRIAHMVLSIARDASGAPVPGLWIAHLELNEAIHLRGSGKRTTSGARAVTRNDLIRNVTFCVPTGQIESFTRTETVGLGISEFDGSPEWQTITAGTSQTVDGTQAILVAPAGTGGGDESTVYVDLPFTMPVEAIFECSLDRTGAEGVGYLWFGTQISDIVIARPSMRVIFTLDGDLSSSFASTSFGGGIATFTDSILGVADSQTFWVRMMIDAVGLSASVSVIGPPDDNYDHTDAYGFAVVTDTPTLLEMGASGTAASVNTLTVKKITILQGLPWVCAPSTLTTGRSRLVPRVFVGTGDGSSTVFPMLFTSYIEGSLVVEIDGLTETNVTGDPATGILTFDSPPFATEKIYAQFAIAT